MIDVKQFEYLKSETIDTPIKKDRKIVEMLEKCLERGDYTGLNNIIVLLTKRADYEKQLSYLIK